MVLTLTIKWGKKKVENVTLDVQGDVATFKATIYSLTGVPVNRQKLLCRKSWKGQLKDDMKFSEMKNVNEKMKITLFGTSEGVPTLPPPTKILFKEDLSASEALSTGSIMKPGLKNLGNTCYLNSTLQCLKAVPELNQALEKYTPSGFTGSSQLTGALGQLFKKLGTNAEAVTPMGFVSLLRQAFPDPFAERAGMNYKQQDADEFYTTLMTKILAPSLKDTSGVKELSSLEGADNLIDALFGLRLKVEMKCQEVEGEKVKEKYEKSHKIVCNIRGIRFALSFSISLSLTHTHTHTGTEIKGAEKVDHLFQGVLAGFEGSIELHSPLAGRNALWKKTTRIDRLPRYICVQFMRFFWKPTPNSRDHAGISCKIMRKVKFPRNLDAYNFCSKRLQDILRVPREKHAMELLAEAERKAKAEREQNELEKKGRKKKKKKTEVTQDEKVSSSNTTEATPMEVESTKVEDDEDGTSAMDVDDEAETAGIGIPKDFRGNYELFAIVTHKGRSSSGGHYMGYVRDKGEDEWINFDDDVVEKCKWEHVEPLAGGGDRDMAYLAFYRVKE